MALPRLLRFPHRRDVHQTLRHGERQSTPLGTLVMEPRASESGRILFIISKKVSKKSSERNRMKRQLDMWALKHRELLKGRRIIIYVAPGAMVESATGLLRRADTLKRVLQAERHL